MKKVLVVYNTMCIGGSTTSLLSILSHLNIDNYEIDLLLAENTGELMGLIPNTVKVLPQACPDNLIKLKKKSLISISKYVCGKIFTYNHKNRRNIMGQIMSYENAKFCKRHEKEYDVAISFLENLPLIYVSNYVKAKRKITWLHVDYIDAGFIPSLDRKCYKNYDSFILVSNQCKTSFCKVFPEYAHKTTVIENIIESNTVKQMAEEYVNFQVDENFINMVTVCRITFSHKGLDRMVNAFIELKKEGIKHNLKWYVIGDGIDFELLNSMVRENDLSEEIILLGEKKNPYPYERQMDCFVLPSRYEGKPMVITEAQILGLPPIVTNYSSSVEQINNGVDGIIVENNDQSIYEVLKRLIANPELLKGLRKSLLKNSYDNLNEIEKVMNLID